MMLKITVNLVQGDIMPTDMAEASADEVPLRCWTGSDPPQRHPRGGRRVGVIHLAGPHAT
jgi:hypothetical protein